MVDGDLTGLRHAQLDCRGYPRNVTRHHISTLHLGLFCLACGFAAPALAEVEPATGRTIVLNSLSVTNVQDLDFGDLAAGTTAGTATVNANTNARTVTGGTVPVGGSPTAAIFFAAGVVNRVFIVQIPNGNITLSNGAGGTMTVGNWTTNGPVSRNLGPTGVATIRVGARLNIAANQAEGDYSGTFNITVIYP